jgi:glutaredoxin
MTLKHLKVPFELVEVNFNEGAHLTEEYAKVRDIEVDEVVEVPQIFDSFRS